MVWIKSLACGLFLFAGLLSAQTKGLDTSNHTVFFLTVAPGVKLEVLDWGGSGRPVVLLAGLPGTPHGFDNFVLKLTPRYHVYGITRRGFGASDKPAPTNENYAADRLGDDVLSVFDQLKLERPVLVGHSFAGEELSSIGSRFPNRVAGLVYLDATSRYAYSLPNRGDEQIDELEFKRTLQAVLEAISPEEKRAAAAFALERLPFLQHDLELQKKDAEAAPAMSAMDYAAEVKDRQDDPYFHAALMGEQRYSRLACPVLAVEALPHDHGLPPGQKRDEVDAWDIRTFGGMAADFEKGVPTARVIRIPHAAHDLYRSNEAQVLQAIDGFIAGLK